MPIQFRAQSPATFGPSREWIVAYASSIVGILKIAQMVFVLIAFLCAVCPGPYYSGNGWVGFATISGFIEATIWFLLHGLNVIPRHVVNRYIEAGMYAIFSLFLLIAAIIVAAAAGEMRKYSNTEYAASSYGASAFFCFLSMFLWIADTVLQVMDLRASGWGRDQPPPAYGAGEQPQSSSGAEGSTADSNKNPSVHY